MGLINKNAGQHETLSIAETANILKSNIEERAESESTGVTFNTFLESLLKIGSISKSQALNIPSLQASINVIANTISSLPIKMYQEIDGEVKEITDDHRLTLLNHSTGDTLTATQFWKAILEDYFLGKGGYAYINKHGNKVESLHYVDETNVSISMNTDPIFKDYNILVNGYTYAPYRFLKFLRKTKDGCTSKSIIKENSLMLSVAYFSLKYENKLVAKGGNKRGFLKSENKLEQPTIDELKASWAKLYSNDESENVVVLNKGLDFKEASNSSVEMQLNEQKLTNSSEISMLINVPNAIIRGNASEQDNKNFIKHCIIPILTDLETSLDRDFLLEKEKKNTYYAFDTKELLRGSLKERYEAYEIALRNNFLQPDEVRNLEDYEPFGFNYMKLGLQDVLFNPRTGDIFTPNRGTVENIEEESLMKEGEEDENRS
ncbi:phage portal protein [Lachnoclostridium sp.]|uniref:phage portal protein n=1 Tax=Lachnoclostridium sp. TaxID=2028282 RepID=UPI0028973041|nr:phage portal protein [Lachnoclostridium sp.]